MTWTCLWCGKAAEGDPAKPDQCEHCETRRGDKSPMQGLAPLPRGRIPKPEPPAPSLGCRIRERLGITQRIEQNYSELPAHPGPTPAHVPVSGDALEPVLILSDAHVPFHSTVWLDLVLQVGRYLRPKYLISNGDLADFYAVSSHDKSPDRAHRFAEELDVVDGVMDQLDDLGAEVKVYVEGNHEDRLKRHLMKDPALFGVVSTQKLLRLEERGWAFVPYKDHTELGAVHFTHDVGSAGRTAVFKALDMYQESIITAHTHRMVYVVEGKATGASRLSASFGWGGDVEQIDYMTKAKARKDWALGFGVGYLHPPSGVVYVVPVPIIHGTCMVNGRLFRASAQRAAA